MTDPTPSEDQIASLRTHVKADARSRAFVDLARALNARGEHAEAAEVAQQGLLAHPDAVDGRLALAVAEAEQGRVREALEQIKRALLIEQDNAEALALMGRILLERGLTKRAVQFLSHAVRLEPNTPAFEPCCCRAATLWGSRPGRAMLPVAGGAAPSRASALPSETPARLRAKSKSEVSTDPPVLAPFGPDAVPDEDSPWQDASEEEHTVFAADAPSNNGEPVGSKPNELEARLAALPVVRDDGEDDEPTRLAGGEEVPSLRDASEEEPTKFAAQIPRRRGLLGGSAAELSQMMRAEAPRAPEPVAEKRPAEANEPKSIPSKAAPKPARPASIVPSKAKAPAAEASDSKPAPKPSRKASAEVKPAVEQKSSALPAAKVSKGIGPVATRMVDDALFAILGRAKSSVEQAPAVAPAPGGGPRPRVVRTSKQFGSWARIAGGLVFAAGAFGIGYAAAVSPGAAPPEVVGEELKGVATELERGGLSALLSAEERISELSRSNPELQPLLDGALAEVHARRYERFGGAPAMRTAAFAALGRASGAKPTVERTVAEVLLSTSAVDLKALDLRLVSALGAYPESPKAWVARAEIAERLKDRDRALSFLTRARSIHPQHRQTLLESARWLARAGAAASALETYALLQSFYDLDVEVAIERYMLGWASGVDSAHDEAVSLLAGLVREEIPEVAKDEAGRAALAFALAGLRDSRVQEGLTALAEAEGAFADSPSFQSTVGRILLAAGEAERAEERFERAIELEPTEVRWGDLGHARYAKAVGARLELEVLRKRVARLQRDLPLGRVRLPYGEVRARPTEFPLAEVTLDAGFFPPGIAEAARNGRGESTEEAVDAAVQAALATKALDDGDFEEARKLIAELRERALRPPEAELAEGRLLLADGRASDAVKKLETAAKRGGGGTLTYLELARAKASAGDAEGALKAYETFFAEGGASPDARLEQAQLQMSRRDDEGALAAIKALDAAEPESPSGAVLRAEIYLEQDSLPRAEKSLARAIELDPGLIDGKPPRGIRELSPALLAEVGRLVYKKERKKALALYRAAIEKPGTPPEAYFYYGKALVAKRKTRKKGRRQLAKYLRLEPGGAYSSEAKKLSRRR